MSPRLGGVVGELEDRGVRVSPVEANLATEEGLDLVASIASPLQLELIVNNAGITRDSRLVNMSEEDFGSVLDVNLGAALSLTQRLSPSMETGAIVNIASRTLLGNFGQFNYTMSKGGLVGITRAFSLSLAPRIRVNAIAPGLISTEMSQAMPEDVRNKIVGSIPMARMGGPTEIAETVAFLAENDYITGSVVFVDGGRSLSR
jgi:NAD(P)-dependent dehydrogenase (short-subunit alcohol dehydrogenase family)